MDILRAEIEKKRKIIDVVKPSEDAIKAPVKKKYMKRGEIEKLQEELESGVAAPTKKASEVGNGGMLFSSKNKDDGAGSFDNDDHIDLPEAEIIGRLRARGEPIRLFGETDRERVRRLKTLESREERTEGQRNDFQSLLDSADRGLALELLEKQAGVDEESEKRKKKKEQDLENVDTSALSPALLEKDPDKAKSLIALYLRKLLHEWEKTLAARPEDVKRSTPGKLQTATQAQAGEYLKPFMKQLKNKSVKEDVLVRVTEICSFMQQREYLKANDSYLRLSIGNAPWPIGVTMVGIHERSAREKIHASQVAHVLNDEVQRKWIQSIKRLMTFAQARWPPDDLGKAIG
ncbi:mRNA splicing protein prp18 [Dinochytrium kinnereticum]|nr:mRNA splicing protein prp18 [Dinochytrium kinnereticum]